MKTVEIPNFLRTVALAKIIQALQPAQTRLVGGVVRDLLAGELKESAALDIDLATQATPEEVLSRLQSAEIKAIPTGIEHGTITAVIDGQSFEITSLRQDVATDGRRATVAYTTDFEVDSGRRDFTFNAMYLAADGTLYDYHNGLEDLRAGEVKFIGDAETRIREDYLRIIRYCRFYARYGTTPPSHETLALLKKYVAEVSELSPERITQEFMKMFSGSKPATGWAMLSQIGVLKELSIDHKEHYSLSALEKHSNLFPEVNNPIERLVCLYGLFTDLLGEESLLVLSHRQSKLIAEITNGLRYYRSEMTAAELLYECGTEAAPAVLRILIAEASLNESDDAENERIALLGRLEEVVKTDAPKFPLQGQDVLDLGFEPGPLVGEILGQIEDWWQEAGFPDRKACQEQLEALLGKR